MCCTIEVMRKRGLKSRVRIWLLRRSTQRLLRICIRSMLMVAAIVIITATAFHLPFISVQSITIAPESDINQVVRTKILTYAEKTLSERAYGIPGKTRHFFKKQEFEDMLRTNFLQADAISVRSSFLNKWHIIAKKRASFGTYCRNTQCLIIDTNGMAFMETDIQVGTTLAVSNKMRLGDQVFGDDASAITDFQKIPQAVQYLEEGGFLVKRVSLRRDTRVVHIELENSIGIWFDTSEALYDTTRALHIVFEEVFSDAEKRAEIISVDVRNPLSILYEKK